MTQSRFRQRKISNFLLQPLLQVRLGFYMILLSTLFSGAVFIVFYTNLSDFAEIVVTLTDSESEIRSLFSNYMSHTKWWVLFMIFGFLVTNILVSITYTHKLIGPTVAFRSHLLKLQGGDFKEQVRLRKGDAFHEVADELNRLTVILRENNGKINPKG